jgi:hypothetical protein
MTKRSYTSTGLGLTLGAALGVLNKTKGNLWRVISYIRKASEVAIQRGLPYLSLEFLNDVWSLYIRDYHDL